MQQLVLQSAENSNVDNRDAIEPLRSVDVKELLQHLAKEEEVIRLRSGKIAEADNNMTLLYRVAHLLAERLIFFYVSKYQTQSSVASINS